MSYLRIFCQSLALLALVSNVANAGQLRTFNPIRGPVAQPSYSAPTEDAERVENPQPVARQQVEQGMKSLLDNWNQGDSEALLDAQFYDRTRLSDSIQEDVPRDASLRLLGVQGSQVLEQYRYQEDGNTLLSSVVSVTANTQMEFNDPESGFRRLNGQNEYIIRIDQLVEGSQP